MRAANRNRSECRVNHPRERRWWVLAGAILLVHAAVMWFIKIDKGIGDDLLWMSHVVLPIAGIGLLLNWHWLIAAALTGILVTHALWLFDLIAWLLGFGFPLHLTDYMAGAPLSTWVSTGHHLYLMPLLVWFIWRRGRYPWTALGAIIVLFACLIVASFVLTDPARNVNRVHGIEPNFGFPPFIWANGLLDAGTEGPRGNVAFLLALNGLSIVILFTPAALVLHMLTMLRGFVARGK